MKEVDGGSVSGGNSGGRQLVEGRWSGARAASNLCLKTRSIYIYVARNSLDRNEKRLRKGVFFMWELGGKSGGGKESRIGK